MNMKKIQLLLITAALACLTGCASFTTMQVGETLLTKTNLHIDNNKRLLYTMNYQSGGILIPACSMVKIKKIKGDYLVFSWQGVNYTLLYDNYTNRAGVGFETAANDFLAHECDSEKIANLSDIDQEGIKSGKALVGMSRAGVYYAMGRPPHHATPHLKLDKWLYWRNRHRKNSVEFDENNIVTKIR